MIRIMKYSEVSSGEIFTRTMPTVNVETIVSGIVQKVREEGDSALKAYTEKFDHARLDSPVVTAEEIDVSAQPSFSLSELSPS